MYLSHWLSLPPAQDRVAMAKLDLEHNSLAFVYRFDTLEDELAKLKGLRARTHERSTSTLEQVREQVLRSRKLQTQCTTWVIEGQP